MTQTCPRCGLALPLASRPVRRAQTDPALGGNQAIDGVWRELDDEQMGGPGGPATDDGPPSWLLRALRDANAGNQSNQGNQGMPPHAGSASTPLSSQPNVPPRGFAAPPAFTREQPGASGGRPPSFPPFPPLYGANGEPQTSAPGVGGFGSGPLGPMPLQDIAPSSGGLDQRQMAPMNPVNPMAGMENRFAPPAQAMVPSGQIGMPAAASGFAGLNELLGPGSVLKGGRYRLIQRFYGGGSAQPPNNEPPLMVATDTELPNGRVLVQEVLLNSVRPEDSENARRLIAQRLLMLASYPAMPRLVDHFGERRRHFLVFELPSGDLLADRLQRAHGPMAETAAIRLALQILDALHVFEQQYPPFIHGNLSPANIILRPSGQVVLVGCSPHLLLYPNGTVDHPPAGGFPGYAAPEQARGQATPRSDLYALCAILQYAVTGIAPATRGNAPRPSARHQNPDVSLELEDVLSHGMRPSSTQRYQSTAELREALEPLAAGHVTHVPDELRDEDARAMGLAPVRDARGRLVLPKKQRRLQNPLFLFGIILTLIVVIGGGVLFAVSPHGSSAPPVPTPNDLAQLVQQQNIGLSGGEFAFDTQRPDGNDKTHGTGYLASGDVADAHQAYLKAMSDDPADAEAAIYAEDLQITLSNAPYFTIVVGTVLDPNAQPSDIAASRAELQGIYLAQHHINSADLLPDGLKVRVLVLNSGATVDGATTAADVLLKQIQRGNAQHLVGIIGWPEIQQTQLARSELKATGLLFIAPTASDDSMKNFEESLFRMVPLNSVQAQNMADTAVQQMNATNVLVLSDPKDPVSAAMAASFATELQNQQTSASVPIPIVVHTATYTSNANTDFTAIARNAIFRDGANLIYLSTGQQGSDLDAIDLARAVVSVSQSAGITAPRILTDSRAYTPALLGLGSSPAASLVQDRSNLAALSDLYVETLADQNEWTALNLTSSVPDTFNNNFENQYGTNLSPDGLVGPNSTVILTYDALRMLVSASSESIAMGGNGTHGQIVYPTPLLVRNELGLFDPNHPFIGISGAISYDLSGNLNGDLPGVDKGPGRSVGILQFIPFSTALADGQVARAQVAFVTGGTSYFCHKATCSLSPV